MSDLERAYKALKIAKESGDEEKALKIAKYARQLEIQASSQEQKEEQPQQQERSLLYRRDGQESLASEGLRNMAGNIKRQASEGFQEFKDVEKLNYNPFANSEMKTLQILGDQFVNRPVKDVLRGAEVVEAGANIAGEVMGTAASGVTNIMLGPKNKKTITDLATNVVEKTGADKAIAAGAQAYESWKEDHKEEAAVLEAGLTIGSIASPAVVKRSVAPRAKIKDITQLEEKSFKGAIRTVQKNLKKVEAKEKALWGKVKPDSVDINSNAIDQINHRIQKNLSSASDLEGRNPILLTSEKYDPLTKELSRLSRGKNKNLKPIKNADGSTTYVDSTSFDEIRDIRDSISSLAKDSNNDGSLRYAAGMALRELDDSLIGLAENMFTKGSRRDINKFLHAVKFSRRKFENFGTSRALMQSPAFERAMNRNPLDNEQLVDWSQFVGDIANDPIGTEEFIGRLLKNSGRSARDVRINLIKGYMSKAISSSTVVKTNGEAFVNYAKLRGELTKIIGDAGSSRLTDGTRKMLFPDKKEFDAIVNFRNAIRDPSKIEDLTGIFGFRFRMAAEQLDTFDVGKKTGIKTRKLTEKEFSKIMLESLQPELKGSKMAYGAFLASTTDEDREK